VIGFVQKDENGNTLINGQLQQNADGRPTEVSQYLWDKFQNNDTNLNETIVVRDNAARDALMQQEGGSDFVKSVHDQFFNYRQAKNPDRNYVYNNPQGQWYQQQYGGVGMPVDTSPDYVLDPYYDHPAQPPVNHGGVGVPGDAPYEGFAPNEGVQNSSQPSSQGGMMADAMRQNALYGLLGLSGRGNPRGLLMSLLGRLGY
jgi:hypothetical protein